MSEGSFGAMPGVAGERRLRQLEALFLGGPVVARGQSFSIETLIDVLLILYDECCNSSLRREKTVSDFIEFGNKRQIIILGWVQMALEIFLELQKTTQIR